MKPIEPVHHRGNPPKAAGATRAPNRLGAVTGAAAQVGTDSDRTGERHGVGAVADPPRRARRRPWVFAAVAYAACSVWLTRGVWRHPTTRWIGVPGDPQAFMWWIAWVPHALRHGLNPLHPTVVQYPDGVNAMWNTSILLPSLVAAPVTWAFGPILSWNLIQAGAPVAGALCAMAALSRFVDRRLPAFVGGLVYGFSPYMTLKMLVHTNLVITILPPIMLLCVHELFVRRRRSPVVVGVVLGLALVGQLLTGEEILLITVIACAIAVAALAALVHRRPVASWREGARGLAVAAGVALVVGTPFVAYQFFGPRSSHCCVPGVGKYVLDAQTLVVPSTFQSFHTSGAGEMAARWQGGSESNAYLGVAMSVFLVIAVVALRHRRAVQVGAIVLVVVTLFAFGSEIQFAGEHTGVPGPWRILHHLPLFGSIVVGRFMFVAYLAVALIVAIVLDTLADRPPTVGTRLSMAGTLLAVVTLAPVSALVTSDHTPEFFRDDAAMDHLLPRRAVVAVSPYFPADAMLWQATANFRFSMIEGHVFGPGTDGTPTHNGPINGFSVRLNALETRTGTMTGTLTSQERQQYLAELARYGVNAIVVGPSAGRAGVERFVGDLTGSPGTANGGVTVYRLDR